MPEVLDAIPEPDAGFRMPEEAPPTAVETFEESEVEEADVIVAPFV